MNINVCVKTHPGLEKDDFNPTRFDPLHPATSI